MTVLIILIAPVAGKLSDRYGSRWLISIGMVLLARLTFSTSRGSPRRDLLGPPARLPDRRRRDVPDDDADRRRRDGAVPVAKAGVGSAVLNAMRQVGGSLGIALMGAIVAHSPAGQLRRGPSRSSTASRTP